MLIKTVLRLIDKNKPAQIAICAGLLQLIVLSCYGIVTWLIFKRLAIIINHTHDRIMHSRRDNGSDITIAILRNLSNSSATMRRSARISRNCACRAANSALAARDMARASRRFWLVVSLFGFDICYKIIAPTIV